MSNRTFAGSAGGKKYFWDQNGKLYDEAGQEQPAKLTAILRANFPPRSAPASAPPSSGQNNQSSQSGPQPTSPSTSPPASNTSPQGANDTEGLGSALAKELLKKAFPDLYKLVVGYRKVLTKGKKKTQVKKPRGQQSRRNATADRKRFEKELAWNVEVIASTVRSNGELLRQQLTAQDRTNELLEKISQGTHGGGGLLGGLLGGILGGFKKAAILGSLAALGTGAIGAFALHESADLKEERDSVLNEEESEKYGKEKADELAKVRNENTLERIQRTWGEISPHLRTDPRSPKERAADQAKKYDEFGIYKGPGEPEQKTDKSTAAIAEAKEKPKGKTIEIKADTITFQAKTITLDARKITANTGSSSTGLAAQGEAGYPFDEKQRPPGYSPANPNGPTPQEQDQRSPWQRFKDWATGKSSPTQIQPGQFNPSVQTPSTNFGTTKPGAPGAGPITGGMGTSTFGGKTLEPKGSGDLIRQNDILPTQSFQPRPNLQGKEEIKEGNAAPGASKQVSEIPYNGTQASIRYNNPGAAWPRQADEKYGIMGYGHIAGDNLIGRFPTPIHGMAANMDLLATSKNYVGQTIGSAIGTWTNHGRNSVPGFRSDQIITPEMTKDPAFMIPFFNEMRKAEGPKSQMTEEQIRQGFEMYMAGSANKYIQQQQEQARMNNVQPANAQNTANLTGGNIASSDLLGSTVDMKSMGDLSKSQGEGELIGNPSVGYETPMAPEVVKRALQQSLEPFNKPAVRPDITIPYPDSPLMKDIEKAKPPAINELLGNPSLSVPTPPAPPEQEPLDIPYNTSSNDDYNNDSHDDSVEGSTKTRVTDPAHGAKKPKPIRSIDMDKYYPQYPKSDYDGQSVGIMVA